jgi:glycosyltransferase involved in cell wall biosynthesis
MSGARAGPPPITVVTDGEKRPRWSVMIPTYNCAAYAAATIESVLLQAMDRREMEIVVVDDASEDGIAEIVSRHADRVRLHQQARNLGVPSNLTDCIRLSRGEFVHILHGDDQVRPGFYAAMERGFADFEIGAVWCRQIYMDHDGEWIGVSPVEAPEGRVEHAARFLAEQQRVMTPSICVRRHAYETVGGFHPELRCVEDWEMWVRIASRFGVYHVREPLAIYRLHDNSNTGRNLRDATETRYAVRAIDLITDQLPPADRAAVRNAARRAVARRALDTGYALARRGDWRTALVQYRAALRLSRSPEILLRWAYNLAALTAGASGARP